MEEKRWQRLAMVLYLFCFIFAAIYVVLLIFLEPTFLGFSLGFFIFGSTIFTSINNYKKKKENPNFIPKIEIPFRVILAIFFLVILTTLFIRILYVIDFE